MREPTGLDRAVPRVLPADVRPTAAGRRREQDDPFDPVRDPDREAERTGRAPEDRPEDQTEDRAIAPPDGDDPGARIDLSA